MGSPGWWRWWGITAYRTAFGAAPGPLGVASRSAWKAPNCGWSPNPSGLNAHETIDSLTDWYRRVADAAGV